MSLFSSVYAVRNAEVRAILDGVRCPSPKRVEEILAQSESSDALSLTGLAELLEVGATAGADEQFEMLRAHTRRSWRAPSGNRVRYVSPIYVSSFCVDACPYCNFSALRKDTVRYRLSLAELDREIASVLARDARVIELVYATDPEYDTRMLVRDVARAVDAVRDLDGGGVLLCTEYLSSQAYEALASAGLRGIVQWDETLDEQAYARWHSASPRKADFRTRMENHDRALAAGLEVATGALFGLADFRHDALMQVARARYFVQAYGRGPFVMGTARLKPIGGRELRLETTVSDRAHETALMVYKIALPQVGRWLQTRETFAMNLRNLLDGDVFTYSCGEVQPGGYTQINTNSIAGAQFGVNEMERGFVERELAGQGFQIDFGWMSPARTLASR
jgi:2-iminoacetate synthase